MSERKWRVGQPQACRRAERRVRGAAVLRTDCVEVEGDAELGGVDGSDADPLGPAPEATESGRRTIAWGGGDGVVISVRVDSEGDGQRLHPELAISLDGLEVVDDRDAEAWAEIGGRSAAGRETPRGGARRRRDGGDDDRRRWRLGPGQGRGGGAAAPAIE